MLSDVYTKAVLTVIAGCLLWLCVARPLLSPRTVARAANTPQEVVVVGLKAPYYGNLSGMWSPIFVKIVPPDSGQQAPKN